jgi:hypothetical protein
MRLAIIVGMFLLSSRTLGHSVPVAAGVILQAAQSQGSAPASSSPQDSATQSPTDQQKTANPPQPAATPCPNNSQSGTTAKSDCKPAAKIPKHRKTTAPAPATTGSSPGKTVVRNGGTGDSSVNLAPGVTPQQASREADNTNKLLATSNANLKKIAGRELSPSQQDTVKQINTYMNQARDAEKDGDVQRAHNLAVKASLLSADLVGPEKK